MGQEYDSTYVGWEPTKEEIIEMWFESGANQALLPEE